MDDSKSSASASAPAPQPTEKPYAVSPAMRKALDKRERQIRATPTAPVIRGRQAVWGIGDSLESGDTYSSGICTSCGRDKVGEDDFLYDDNGFVIAQNFFNEHDELSVEIICEAATAQPERGDKIQINGVADALVQSSKLKWQQRGWKGLSVSAKKWPNLVDA